MNKVEKVTEFGKEIYTTDQEGNKQGMFVELSTSGDTLFVANYKDDKLDGKRSIYAKEGYVKTVENYKEDMFHGPILTYYDNGQLQTKGNYTNNVLDKDFYLYYETGELKEKSTISDNEENGPFEEYYKSGVVHWKGTFIGGTNEVGPLLEYDEQGVLIKKMECGLYLDEYICQTVWDIEKGDIPLKIEYDQ